MPMIPDRGPTPLQQERRLKACTLLYAIIQNNDIKPALEKFTQTIFRPHSIKKGTFSMAFYTQYVERTPHAIVNPNFSAQDAKLFIINSIKISAGKIAENNDTSYDNAVNYLTRIMYEGYNLADSFIAASKVVDSTNKENSIRQLLADVTAAVKFFENLSPQNPDNI